MHQEFYLTTTDHLELYGQAWSHGDEFKGVVCIVHGMGEHSGRYNYLASVLNSKGVAVVAMDHRGHGKSMGPRGHTPSLDQLLDDVSRLNDKAKQLFPGKPVFLFGQSMGGNLVLNYGIRRKPDVKGIVASSPYLTLAFEPPAWKVFMARVVGGIVPGLTQATGLDTAALSRDPEVIKAYVEDPLVHDKMSANFFNHVHFAGPYCIENAAGLEVRTLVMHGSADRITSFDGSRKFCENAHAHVEFKPWEGMFHELHNEPEKDTVIQHMVAWIEKRLSS